MNSRRRDRLALSAAMVGYSFWFVLFYPPISGIEDEIGFVNQALVWSRGAISSEGAGFREVVDFGEPGGSPRLMDFERVGDRHVAARHPGRSLVALPFIVVGGVSAAFLSGLAIHLATTMIGASLFERSGRSPLWAVLLLFHPTLALYARTITADGAAGACLLLAVWAFTLKKGAGASAGLAVGAAALMRYHAGLMLPAAVAAFLFPRERRRTREAIACLVAGTIAGSTIVAYNYALYGSPIDPFSARRGRFGGEFVAEHLAFYASALLLIWPGMLAAPAFDRAPASLLTRATCWGFLAFFCAYYFHDRTNRWIETAVVGQRLLQVALPVWIASYVGVLDDMIKIIDRRDLARAFPTRSAVALICVALWGGVGVIFWKHQGHLTTLKAARDLLVENVPDGSLLISGGSLHKLFGVPNGGPAYRFRMHSYQGTPIDHSAEIAGLREAWYFGYLLKPGESPPESALDLVKSRGLVVVSETANLRLYKSNAPR